MKKLAVTVSLVLMTISQSVLACPGCNAALGQKGAGNWGFAFGWSIFLMLGSVMSLFAAAAFTIFRVVRAEETGVRRRLLPFRVPLKFVLPVLGCAYVGFVGYSISYGSARSMPETTVYELTDDVFASSMAFHQGPKLIEFGATWCPVCQKSAPAFDRIAQERSGDANFFKVNLDLCPRTRERLKIESFPCIVLFQDKKEVARRTGAFTAAELNSWLAQNLKQP